MRKTFKHYLYVLYYFCEIYDSLQIDGVPENRYPLRLNTRSVIIGSIFVQTWMATIPMVRSS